MKLYFSSPRYDVIKAVKHKNVLLSFAVNAKKSYQNYIDEDINILIDSGAFSIYNSGKTVDIEEYYRFIENSPISWNFISLDVIPPDNPTKKELMKAVDQGFENYKYLSKLNHKILPTYHYGEPISILKKYISITDYICAGPKRGAGQSADEYYKMIFKNTTNQIKVHGLANTSLPSLLKYPFYSVDSISYLKFKVHRDSAQYWAQGKLDALLYTSARRWINLQTQVTKIWNERGIKWD